MGRILNGYTEDPALILTQADIAKRVRVRCGMLGTIVYGKDSTGNFHIRLIPTRVHPNGIEIMLHAQGNTGVEPGRRDEKGNQEHAPIVSDFDVMEVYEHSEALEGLQ